MVYRGFTFIGTLRSGISLFVILVVYQKYKITIQAACHTKFHETKGDWKVIIFDMTYKFVSTDIFVALC